MSSTLSRRAALGALVSAPALAIPAAAVMLAEETHTLAGLITEHGRARAAFHAAIDELEAIDVERDGFIAGIAGAPYSLKNSREIITKLINDHAAGLHSIAYKYDGKLPGDWGAFRTAVDAEQRGALDRLAAAYADKDEAQGRYYDAADAEADALEAICAHRCGSTEELEGKLRYLAPFRPEFTDEQHDALFGSLYREE